MKIAILGYGVEGKDTEQYFTAKGHQCTVFDQFTPEQIPDFGLEQFDLVFRSPSVHPPQDLPTNWTSITKYFFQECPCSIIGVTGTKGKGTTCSLLAAILNGLGQNVQLVGNIGTPALDVLDQLSASDVVIYELSSFQLWDLQQSPHLAVVLRIEPDHLNIHDDFDDYVRAKSNITRHQSSEDSCIYYRDNSATRSVAELSPGTKLPYPITEQRQQLDLILDNLAIVGQHNHENAEAALLAAAAFMKQPLPDFLTQHQTELTRALANFQGLPHRLEFVRELDGVKYYDDNFSSAFPALDVALQTFADQPTILIAGGKDRGLDLSATRERIFHAPNLTKVILIGETKEQLAKDQDPAKYQLAQTLPQAVQLARELAQATSANIVLMSPGAASFDMFENFKDRGEQYQTLVKNL